MIYRVQIEEPARRELRRAFTWIAERSPRTALRWLDRVTAAIEALDLMPEKWGLARESRKLNEPIRQLLFGRGQRKYRALFIIREDVVYVLHFRHWAQRTMSSARVVVPSVDNDAP